MGREQKNLYCFITDDNGKFHRAIQEAGGDYTITKNSSPYPILYNPINLEESKIEFATNKRYFSLNRSVTNPLDFVKDGAAILRNLYFLGKGAEEKAYLTIVQWDGVLNYYTLAYYGKIDFSAKNEDPKAGLFTVPVIDDSAWGILSQNDSTKYSIDCSAKNPKAIKVMIDGITLINNYTYQTVQAPVSIIWNGGNWKNDHYMPFVLVNEDGDSSGIMAKNQAGGEDIGIYIDIPPPTPIAETSGNWFFQSMYAINGVTIKGTFKFVWSIDNGHNSGKISVNFVTSKGQRFTVFANGLQDTPTSFNLVPGKMYQADVNITLNLQAGEKIFFITRMTYQFLIGNQNFAITPIVTNIVVSCKTTPEPRVTYALRPLDLVKEIVRQATNGRFTMNSEWFTVNNKKVITCGDAIRGIDNAQIYTSFQDFFDTYNSLEFMALRNITGELWMEKATEVYKQDSTIIDIGDCIDLKLNAASDYLVKEVEVGSPKQDFRRPSGRNEFNSTNTFSLAVFTTQNKLDIVTTYRTGCYDIIFLILDHVGASTKDNTGDKSVYVLDITDERGFAAEDISNFVNIDIDNALLQPIIKSPLSGDSLTYNKPIIRGITPPGTPVVNIYVDNVLEGQATILPDGEWFYNIQTALEAYVLGISTGIHVIQATFTDLAAPNTSITITIDTSDVTDLVITYPTEGDTLYNNKPIIRGHAQFGTVIDVRLNGNIIGLANADESNRWFLDSPSIPQGSNVLTVNNINPVNFEVDAFVEYPLITWVDGELDGFVVKNNLPLIKGVGVPGTVVSIWLNYISYNPLGTAIIDAFGNWQFQVVPISYTDPLSGLPVVMAPIQNGLNIFSTSLDIHTVEINVSGFKLNRPAFTSITGVPNNTVFNVNLSPKRMLLNWAPMLAGVLDQQPQENLYFQTADKNAQLKTTIGGVTIAESDDVPRSLLGSPLIRLEYANLTTRTSKTFAKILEEFNNGGVVKTRFRGRDIFMLPVGTMKMAHVTSEVQEWKLLISPLTPYSTLLNLYKNGLIINLMTNAIYHSDYNTLHFVSYNYTMQPQHNFKTIYQDWFESRNDAWLANPTYIQKMQRTEFIVDQVISNGIIGLNLVMYRCSDAKVIDTKPYLPVTPAPIPGPDVVMEATFNLAAYPEDQYFFVMESGATKLAISERIETKDKWLGTILINSTNSVNMTGAFFSSGWKSVLRVEGLIKKLQPNVISNTSREEDGDTEMLYSSVSKKRTIRFGTAFGLPDYLYLKIANAIVLDSVEIEGVYYTLENEERIQPSDDVDGHPMYYYNVNMTLEVNRKGLTVGDGTPSSDVSGVILVVDAEAIGLPAGSLINIQLGG